MKAACCRGLDAIIGAVDDLDAPGHVLLGSVSIDLVGQERSKKYLVMHIENPSGLVAKEKGSGIAWLTSNLVPDYVENRIYNEVSNRLREDFKAKGSPVDVRITEAPPRGAPVRNDLLTGAFIGGGVAAVVWLLARLLLRKRSA